MLYGRCHLERGGTQFEITGAPPQALQKEGSIQRNRVRILIFVRPFRVHARHMTFMRPVFWGGCVDLPSSLSSANDK